MFRLFQIKFFVLFYLSCCFSENTNFPNKEIQNKRNEEDKILAEIFRRNAIFYQLNENEELKEITGDILSCEFISNNIKKNIQKNKRRFFVFKYPSDGYLVKGYINYIPNPENFNLLIKLRGGSGFFGLEGPADFYNLIKDYTIVGTTYRGGVSEGRDEYGGQDLNDVLNLIKFIPKLEKKLGIKITLKKKFLLGSSRGGNQMFLALNRYPPLQSYFDKALSLSAPLDLKMALQYYPEMKEELIKHCSLVSEEWLKLRNPMENIDNISSCLQILIVQGGKDIYVPIEAGKRMYEALREKGCDVEYIEVEEGSHCLMNLYNLVESISQWLEK